MHYYYNKDTHQRNKNWTSLTHKNNYLQHRIEKQTSHKCCSIFPVEQNCNLAYQNEENGQRGRRPHKINRWKLAPWLQYVILRQKKCPERSEWLCLSMTKILPNQVRNKKSTRILNRGTPKNSSIEVTVYIHANCKKPLKNNHNS